jgi:hypothetical protein
MRASIILILLTFSFKALSGVAQESQFILAHKVISKSNVLTNCSESIIGFDISKSGHVTTSWVISSTNDIASTEIQDIVLQWKFKPAVRNYQAVGSELVELNYHHSCNDSPPTYKLSHAHS